MTINNHQDEIGIIGYILSFTLLILLIIAGIISYRTIDWKVLEKMESQQLIIPPVSTSSSQIQSPVSTPSNSKK